MTASASSYDSMPASVQTKIKYVTRGETTRFYPGDRDRSYWPGEMHDVTVYNLRAVEKLPTVKDNGFALMVHDTAMSETDYQNEDRIQQIYYPEMIELAKQVNGAVKAIAFGHVGRSNAQGSKQHLLPAYAAHVDYGRRTIEEYVRNILGEEADYWLQKRVVLMNFWRPIKTVYQSPLSLCDASTVLREDLHPAEVYGGLNDPDRPPLYGWNLSYNPDHRWYYTHEMRPEEIYGFKLYDSVDGIPQWTGHTAIDLPCSAEDAPPRQSMEIRTISFVED